MLQQGMVKPTAKGDPYASLMSDLALALVAEPALAQDSAANASAAGGASSEVATHLAAAACRRCRGGRGPASVAGGASMVGGTGRRRTRQPRSRRRRGQGGNTRVASALKVDDKIVVSQAAAPAVPYDVKKTTTAAR